MSSPEPGSVPVRPTGLHRGGATWAALAVLLLFLVLFGIVPLYAYVAARNLPSDVTTRQATVVDTHDVRLNARSNGVRGVAFRLPDGTEGSFTVRTRFLAPHAGDTVTVYRRDGAWHSPAEYGTATLLEGVGAVVVLGGLSLAWVRVRRRSRGDVAGDAFGSLPRRG